jgi:argininosuccinate synthase
MKIVLAYSGGLDTSVIVKWLHETYDAEIVTFCRRHRPGGGAERPAHRRREDRRLQASTSLDLAEEFARDFIYPMIRAGRDLRGPILPRHLDRAPADRQGAGGNRPQGKGRRRGPRRDRQGQRPSAASSSPTWRSTPRLEIHRAVEDRVASASEFPGRAEMIDYCAEHKIPVEASLKKPYSMDRNLLHISYEAGILEDPWFDPTTTENKGYVHTLSVSPEDAPNKAEYVELDFEKGNCVAVNGKRLSPAGVLKVAQQARRQTRHRPR